MRLRIRHETTLTYSIPASRTIQILRLTPRGHEGQFVLNWQVEVDRDCRVSVALDAFGNVVHSFTVEGPIDTLSITASGEVETEETGGMILGQAEPLPPALFLRDTALTEADEAIAALAGSIAEADPIPRLHALMYRVRDAMTFVTGATAVATTAAEALSLRTGVCQDFAHIFVSAARQMGFPARYVGGYLFREGIAEQDAGHGWAEVFVPDLGWIGFDPLNGIAPTGAYVRAACGLDYQGAAPIRGSRTGGSGEVLAVKVSVEALQRQARVARVNVPQPPPGPAGQGFGESSQ